MLAEVGGHLVLLIHSETDVFVACLRDIDCFIDFCCDADLIVDPCC